MPFGFGRRENAEDLKDKKLMVKKARCPQNHACPSVRVCAAGALTQNGYAAPKVDNEKCTRCGRCVRYCPMRALVLE